ncbi:MAG: hypothetical protein WC284_14775 [Candidimonas sp.]
MNRTPTLIPTWILGCRADLLTEMKRNKNNRLLPTAFQWVISPEGYDYWKKIHDNGFDENSYNRIVEMANMVDQIGLTEQHHALSVPLNVPIWETKNGFYSDVGEFDFSDSTDHVNGLKLYAITKMLRILAALAEKKKSFTSREIYNKRLFAKIERQFEIKKFRPYRDDNNDFVIMFTETDTMVNGQSIH